MDWPGPAELQDLTWMEELLIAHAHLTGCIIRLQNRNSVSHFSLKVTLFFFHRTLRSFSTSFLLPHRICPTSCASFWLENQFETSMDCVTTSPFEPVKCTTPSFC